MNTRIKLNEIKRLLEKANSMLESVIEAQPKPDLGKPPQPNYTQKVAIEIWKVWEKLKIKGQFDVNDVWEIVKGKQPPVAYRMDSSYSAILSKWAKAGHIHLVRQGRGRLTSIYKIAN